MLRPDQLPDMHGDITEFITEETSEAHEGGWVSDDLLCVGDYFIPVRRSWAREQTKCSMSSPGPNFAG